MYSKKYKTKTKRRMNKKKRTTRRRRQTIKRLRTMSLRNRKTMRGGGYPLVGAPFHTDTGGNFYIPSKVGVPSGGFDPARPAPAFYSGGKGKGKGKHSQKGGGVSSFISGILPDEIVNFGRFIPSSLGHLADRFQGVVSSPSSLVYPTQQPHVVQGSSTSTAQMAPVDVMGAFNKANASVLSI